MIANLAAAETSVRTFFGPFDADGVLRRLVFPALLKDRAPAARVRIWVPACATGEEAYALAITLLDYLEEEHSPVPIKVFATDASAANLVKARAAVYDRERVQGVPYRLRRFFEEVGADYQVHKVVRESCVFAAHEVTSEPPISKLDLISWRHVAEPDHSLFNQLSPIFHYALNHGGLLLAPGVDAVNAELFTEVDKTHGIYCRSAKPGSYRRGGGSRAALASLGNGQPGGVPEPLFDVQREADRAVLFRYGPRGVVVDEDLHVVQFRGQTGLLLEPPPGSPTLDVLQMARAGLLAELRAALEESRQHNRPARREGVEVKVDGAYRMFNVQVLPIKAPKAGARYFVVLFEEPPALGPRDKEAAQAGAGPVAEPGTNPEVARLRHELMVTRGYLQSIIGDKEASNEELQAANEEVSTANEELHSTNEELEAAREELETVNEELRQTNEDLQQRMATVTKLSDDLANLIDATQVPTLVVGSDLRLRRLSPSAMRLLNLLTTDVGRPLGNFNINFHVNLEALIQEVIDTLSPKQLEVTDQAGSWFQLVVRPYRTADHKIDGAVLTFIDIDALKRRERQLKEAYEYMVNIVEAVRQPLVILNADLRVRSANPAFYEAFQSTPARVVGQHFFRLGNRQWDVPSLHALLEDVLSREHAVENFHVECVLPALGTRVLLVNARRMVRREREAAPHYLLAIEDITEHERMLSQLRENQQFIEKLANTVPCIVYLRDVVENRNVYTNGYFTTVLGYPAGEAQLPRGPLTIEKVHPHDRAKLEQARRRWLKARDGEVVQAEFRVRHASGDWRWLRTWSTVFSRSPDGSPRQVLGLARDVTEERCLEQEVLEIVAREQRRIGQELHDTVGQEVTGLGMLADALTQKLDAQSNGQTKLATKIRDGLQRVHGQIRSLARGLVPVQVDAEGLRAALADLAARTNEQPGLTCAFSCPREVLIGDPATATHLFRIAQEAVANALRHGRAQNIDVALLREETAWTLRIVDDGVGFPDNLDRNAGLGIRIMRFRADLIGATLTIGPGEARRGTVVTCSLARETS
jgi:PAS domain S-box-containing protein